MDKRIIFRLFLSLLLFGGGFSMSLYFFCQGLFFSGSICAFFVLIVGYYIIMIQFSFISKMKFIISAIDNKDYMFNFVENKKYKDVNNYLNTMKKMLENARKEIEQNEVYYQLVLDNISSGVIIANKNNSVLKVNSAAKDIFQIDNILHIQYLSRYYPGLSEVFETILPNTHKTFTLTSERFQSKISIQLTHWEKNNRLVKIYTINNFSNELNEKELESWSRLTRVLTHEIMNSLTPIISISQMLISTKEIDDPDIKKGLNVISNTSNSLVKFVDNYRRLSRVPTPIMSPVYVMSIVSQALALFDVDNSKINFEVNITQNDLMFFVDEGQILQIVINLIKNGIESIGDSDGKVIVEAYCEQNEDVILKVSDTGDPIPADVAEHIFIPFFTTKESGSGIGLSISRQIMSLHNGSIMLLQGVNYKTFVLTFK